MTTPRARRGERGSASLELVLVAPLLIMFILFVVGLGRLALARQDVTAAAHDAARAASLERILSRSTTAGEDAARATLVDSDLSCTGLDVSVDVSDYRPGGHVTADVTCTANLTDLGFVGFPGTKTYTAHAVVPIEQFRAEP